MMVHDLERNLDSQKKINFIMKTPTFWANNFYRWEQRLPIQ